MSNWLSTIERAVLQLACRRGNPHRGMVRLTDNEGNWYFGVEMTTITVGNRRKLTFTGFGPRHEVEPVESVTFTSPDESILKIVSDPDDPLSAWAVGVAAGAVTLPPPTADAHLGEGISLIQANPIDFTVVSPEAVTGEVFIGDEEPAPVEVTG